MQVTSQRASAILYNYLSGNHFDKPFLLPANVCPVVPLSFMKAGVGFEFIDIDESHAMSTEKVLYLCMPTGKSMTTKNFTEQ